MKALFLLVVLTQNGAGDINASFVNTDTLEQCQQKTLMLESVFAASNIPVIESRCIQSNLKFSEFEHALTASKIRHFYLLQFEGLGVQVETMPDWRMCIKQRDQASESARVYCASSVQSIGLAVEK